jgi:hypothetical protein
LQHQKPCISAAPFRLGKGKKTAFPPFLKDALDIYWQSWTIKCLGKGLYAFLQAVRIDSMEGFFY